MHHSKINILETDIRTKGLPGFNFYKSTVSSTTWGNQQVAGVKRPGFDSFYYKEETEKERIVLHFTVGNLRGDLTTLMGEDHVSVPYLIARDGTIYQLFDPKYWSYHLGQGAIGGNQVESKKTIGIELSNYGPLRLNRAYPKLDTVYSTAAKPDVYCDLKDEAQFMRVPDGFRGYTFFASHTDAQYNALNALIDYLTERFDIDRFFLPESERYDVVRDVPDFSGIVSHINYRQSGKWDIGPAFDWNRIIQGITAQ